MITDGINKDKYVWGFQCWFAEEDIIIERFKKNFSDDEADSEYTIEYVELEEIYLPASDRQVKIDRLVKEKTSEFFKEISAENYYLKISVDKADGLYKNKDWYSDYDTNKDGYVYLSLEKILEDIKDEIEKSFREDSETTEK